MRSQVQVLAGPPTNPGGQSVAAIKASALPLSVVHIWSTSRPTRHRQPPRESGPNGPATPGPPPGTDVRSGTGRSSPSGAHPGGAGRPAPLPGPEVRGAERAPVGEGEPEGLRLHRPAGKMLLQCLDHR